MKPTVVFDGECAFCRYCVDQWRVSLEGRFLFRPFQEAAADFPQISPEQFRRSVFLMTDAGVARGADAVFRILAEAGHPNWLQAYLRLPGFAWISERGYAFVTRHRALAFRVVKAIGS